MKILTVFALVLVLSGCVHGKLDMSACRWHAFGGVRCPLSTRGSVVDPPPAASEAKPDEVVASRCLSPLRTIGMEPARPCRRKPFLLAQASGQGGQQYR